MKTIGILVSTRKKKPIHKRPIEQVSHPNLNLVFGSKLSVVEDQVFLEHQNIDALYDRFPSRILPQKYPDLVDINVPVCNPPAVNRMFEDKVETQLFLEKHNIPIPEMTTSNFKETMSKWNNLAIAKPRFGAFGIGITLTETPPPLKTKGLCGMEQTIIQKYIRSPFGYKGISVRQLMFRNVDYSWFFPPSIARCSKTDVIVNASRGADLIPAVEILPKHTLNSILSLSQQVSVALSAVNDHVWLTELGLDFIIDEHWNPWLIELNGQPKGRYQEIAYQRGGVWAQRHLEAVKKPLITLLEWIS